MGEAGLNNLLKWGITNSAAAQPGKASDEALDTANDPSRGLNADLLAQLLGGPSDADLMREAMAAIQSPEVDLDNKLIAFDNFEQLIENLDNANNMESLGLWMPLVEQLDNVEGELRRMAAWCIGTAVQNNARSQERCMIVGAIPKLTKMALNDSNQATKKKAIFALSSAVRNYQPGFNELLKELPVDHGGKQTLDAAEMGQVDTVIDKLRNSANQPIPDAQKDVD